MASKTSIKVFIASPGDLAAERIAFRSAIESLNMGFGDGAGVHFEALGWEDTLASTGRRPQAIINADIDSADIFVLVLHRRWGQHSPDSAFSSYTEEEFHRALARWKETCAPEIFILFKDVDPASIADPGEQLKKVLKFRQQLEESRTVLYRFFQDVTAFEQEIDKHLRAYVRGQLPKPNDESTIVIFPIEFQESLEQARNDAKRALELADTLALHAAEKAARAATLGRIEEARQEFAFVQQGSTDSRVLNLAFDFYLRIGDLSAAESTIQRLQTFNQVDDTSRKAEACIKLGQLYLTRGNLEKARHSYHQAIAGFSQLGDQQGIARAYGKLAVVHQMRGELAEAEALHKKALEIERDSNNKVGVAQQLSNLGIIYRKRNDLKQAEQVLNDALSINQDLGRTEGIANQYGNLGLVYWKQGKFEDAEKMHKKSLALNRKLGRREHVAREYGNLGLLYRDRGDLKRATTMYRKSLTIEDEVGHLEGKAIQLLNLGEVYLDKKKHREAEKLLRESLSNFSELGHREGMAECYRRLALIEIGRNDALRTRQMLSESLRLFTETGMQQEAEQVDAELRRMTD